MLSILLIIEGCSMLKQTIWPLNLTSRTKLSFNKFVANVLRDNIGIVIFDFWGHGGCWRPKTPLRGQKWHEGVDLLKKILNKFSQQPQKLPNRSNQIWAMTSDKEDTATSSWGCCCSSCCNRCNCCNCHSIIRAFQWFCKVSKPLQLQMISGRFYKFKNRHLEF